MYKANIASPFFLLDLRRRRGVCGAMHFFPSATGDERSRSEFKATHRDFNGTAIFMRMISPFVMNTTLGFDVFYLPFFSNRRGSTFAQRYYGSPPPTFDTATLCVCVLAVGMQWRLVQDEESRESAPTLREKSISILYHKSSILLSSQLSECFLFASRRQ